MASKKIHTRRNLDLDPPEIVDDPEKIIIGIGSSSKSSTSYILRASSLPGSRGVQNFEDLEFDEKFEKTLFRSKSENELT